MVKIKSIKIWLMKYGYPKILNLKFQWVILDLGPHIHLEGSAVIEEIRNYLHCIYSDSNPSLTLEYIQLIERKLK